MKVYAVKVGRQPGIYLTWPEAEAQVKGFSGAQYKSFSTMNDAHQYLSDTPIPPVSPIPLVPPGTIIYTDGSCIDQKGGYGLIILRDNQEYPYAGAVPYVPCTNQKAELYAILQALTICSDLHILIRTDSKYAIGCLTEWLPNWKRNGWKTAGGSPVLNRDLIEQIDRQMRDRDIRFDHVYGHMGNKYNEWADQLANHGRLMI